MSGPAPQPPVLNSRQLALLEAVSTALRREILHLLSERGAMKSSDLMAVLGVTRRAVIDALKILEELDVVRTDQAPGSRQGRRVLYEANPAALLEIIETISGYILPSTITLRVSGPLIDEM